MPPYLHAVTDKLVFLETCLANLGQVRPPSKPHPCISAGSINSMLLRYSGWREVTDNMCLPPKKTGFSSQCENSLTCGYCCSQDGLGSYFQEAKLLGTAAKDCGQVVPDVHSEGGCCAADDSRLYFVVLRVSTCPASPPHTQDDVSPGSIFLQDHKQWNHDLNRHSISLGCPLAVWWHVAGPCFLFVLVCRSDQGLSLQSLRL